MSTQRIVRNTGMFVGSVIVLLALMALLLGIDSTTKVVKTLAEIASQLSPVVTAVAAVYGVFKFWEARRAAKKLQEPVPVWVTSQGQFLRLCDAPRSMFTPEQRGNFVGACLAPYCGRDEAGRKRFFDVPELVVAQNVLFPQIVAGEIDVCVLEVNPKEFGHFTEGKKDVQLATDGYAEEYAERLRQLATSQLPPAATPGTVAAD